MVGPSVEEPLAAPPRQGNRFPESACKCTSKEDSDVSAGTHASAGARASWRHSECVGYIACPPQLGLSQSRIIPRLFEVIRIVASDIDVVLK